MNLHNPNNKNGQPQKSIQVTPEDLTIHQCPCGSETFLNATKIGVLSAVHPKNETGKKQHVSVPVVVCTNCNEVFEG